MSASPDRPPVPGPSRTWRRFTATAVLAALALLGTLLVSPTATAAPVPTAAAGPAGALRVGTWNTDLVPWVGNQQEVVDTVAGTDLDVLALQAVWTQAAADAITGDPRVAARYPYTFYTGAQQQPARCTSVSRTEQENWINAVIGRGFRTDQQAQTPADDAGSFLGLNVAFLSQPCFECLANTMATLPNGRPALGAIDICAQGQGVKYGFGGQAGQLVLSASPITDLTTADFTTFALRRVNVVASIGGLTFGFASWSRNDIEDADPGLGPLQGGALQPELAEDMLSHGPDVLLGTVNSSPGYQPAAYQLLTDTVPVDPDNPPAPRTVPVYSPAFSQPTFCPQATHSSAAQCAPNVRRYLSQQPVDREVDNVFASDTTVCEATGTFGTATASDHIGLTAVCSPATAPTLTGAPPAAVPNTPYSFTFGVGGNPTPSTSVSAGTLPPGLTLSPTGTLAGTPTTLGTWSFTVRATNSSGTADLPVTLTVAVGAPATVTASGGAGQTAVTGQPFGTPLTATVTDSVGNPVAGQPVVFTVTGGATFPGAVATATVTSDAAGRATAPTLTAGRAAGPVTVRAGAGAATPATFALTVTEARADVSVTVSAPDTAPRNGRFTVTLTAANAGPAPASLTGAGLTLPAGLRVVSAPGGAVTRDARSVGYLVVTLAPGTSRTWSVTVATDNSSGSRTVLAAAASTTRDPSLGNNAARDTVRVG